MKRGGGFGIAIGALSSALAAAPRAVVTTEAGVHGCLSSVELAARVESAFAGAEAPPEDQTLQVSVSRAAGDGLVADIRWLGATHETPRRTLESASIECSQLDDAVPLVARALWEAEIAPRDRSPQKEEDEAPVPSEPASPQAPPPAIANRPTPPRDAGVRAPYEPPRPAPIQVSFGAVGALGVLEDAALGLRADVRISLGRQASLRVAATRLSDGRVTEVDGGRAQFRAATGRAAGCWVASTVFSLDACLGVEAGALLPQLSHVARADEDARALLWPIALVAGRLRLVGPLVAQGAVAAGPALFRRDFYVIDGRGERQPVLRAAPALMEASLSLGLELP